MYGAIGAHEMILDNLFASFGGVGTSAALFAIIAFISAPAVSSVACPMNPLRRMQPRGR
jgi:hypothetical protein